MHALTILVFACLVEVEGQDDGRALQFSLSVESEAPIHEMKWSPVTSLDLIRT